MAEPYAAPLDRLLALGRPAMRLDTWEDYRALGIGDEHVAELIRLAADPELLWTDAEDERGWAPIHAWRALGQLRAEAAVDPLLEVLDELEDSDWAHEDLPLVFGMIGAAAVPSLARYLADSDRDEWNRTAAAGGLKEIARAHPEARDDAVAALARQMGKWYRSPETVNSFVMSYLVDLGVREAAPEIEAAFEADAVDLLIRGDWEDVQVDLGLIPERTTPAPKWRFRAPRLAPSPAPAGGTARGAGERARAKARRKTARRSRKQNRRRR